MKKLLLIFVLFIFANMNMFSQTMLQLSKKETGIVSNGKITGRVIDSVSALPIDYASIGILQQDNNKEINGTTTDEKGNFVIHHIPDGTYQLIIYFIGYKNGTVTNIQVNKSNRVINLGDLKLVSDQANLKEIIITDKTNVLDYKIDKMIYNAQNDITSQSGAAIDILRKVPQVTVDINGNVELQGNSNIRFLINGKSSSIFGNSLADALASIPASQIKSIEAITSPGAKYDAQGTGGIINIILKDNNVKGINGNVNLSAGTRLENGSLNLNLKNNNIGLHAFFSGNAQLHSHTPNSQDRNSTDTSTSTTTHLSQNGYTDFQRNGYSTGLGFEWSICKNNSLNGGVTYNQFNNHSRSFIDEEQITEDHASVVQQDISTLRYANNNNSIGSIDCNLNYLKKFKKEGQELSIGYVSSFGKPSSDYIQTQTYAGAYLPYTGSSSSNPGKDNNREFSIDYVHPVSEQLVIETGLKNIQQTINSLVNMNFLDLSSQTYQNDPTQSYQLNYTLKIVAGYVSTSSTVFKWLDIKAGVRAEYTDIKIDYANTTVPAYTIIVPSLIFSHKLKKGQQLKMAYTRRIERPDYSELNPFMNMSDPHNIVTGNPKLLPEIGDNIEFGYAKTFTNGGNVFIGVNERINTQDIKQMTTFYPSYQINDSIYSTVSVTNRQNIGAEYNSGGNISASFPLTEKCNLRGNFSISSRYIVSSLYTGSIYLGFRFRGNLNLTYQLPENFIIEAFGNYNSVTKNIQGRNPQSITYTIAFRKQFWNKNASIGFTATNPFNKYIRQETTISTTNYTAYTIRELPYRSFGISFTYKFGKLEFKKNKEDGGPDYLNNPPGTN